MEISVVNNDTTAATVGDIAASSSQNFGAVLALADSSALNILGVWQTSTPEGRVGQVKDGLLEVNCVALPAVGDKLYVSGTVEGKATNVKPAMPYYIGSVIFRVTLATGVHKATVVFNSQAAEGGITAAGARTSLQTGPAGAFGAVPAFVANAASIAPGTDKFSIYNIEAARTIAAASALTIATTGTPCVGNKMIACYALNLGYVLSVVNGGPLAGTLGIFEATQSKPRGLVVYWDGTNYRFVSYYELLP